MGVKAEMLLAGTASGRLLVVTAPLSFWGGVDARSGCIIDQASDRAGESIAGRILVLSATRGSSSSSSVLLELIRQRHGPAALILEQADAILPVAVIVARELGYAVLPVARLGADDQRGLPNGRQAKLLATGELTFDEEPR